MHTKSRKTPAELFDQWKTEDKELGTYVAEIRNWMNEVNQLGIPHFGEAGVRLTALRQRLLQHFKREDEIIESLAANFSDANVTVSVLRSHSDLEHQQILQRADSLMERLGQLEPPFESWVAMLHEIELFVDGLNQHEKDESKQVSAMLRASKDRL